GAGNNGVGNNGVGNGDPEEDAAEPKLDFPVDLEKERDPVVLAIIESKPESPAELMQTVKVTVDLARYDLARYYLAEILSKKLPAPELIKLHKKFGSPLFLRLARDKELQPHMVSLTRDILAASSKAAREPQVINGWISRLNHPDAEAQLESKVNLQMIGGPAVIFMVRDLANPDKADKHAAIRAALASMEAHSTGPLMSLVSNENSELQVQAVEILARMRVREAMPFFVSTFLKPNSSQRARLMAERGMKAITNVTPSRTEGIMYLRKKAGELLNGELVGPDGVGSFVDVWFWDPRTNTAKSRSLLGKHAGMVMASRVAKELVELNPEDRDDQRLYLAAALAEAKLFAGLEKEIPASKLAKFAEAGPEAIERTLNFALDRGYEFSALGAIETLGRIGSMVALDSTDGRPRPLARALSHKSREIRFAALKATLQIQPTRNYVGAGKVPQLLAYFASTTGEMSAVVGMPRPQHAQAFAGWLTQLGYEGSVAYNGKEVVRLALANPDCDVILLSDIIPRANEVIQVLRHDPRTARIPIGVLVSAGSLEVAPLALEDFPQVKLIRQAATFETFAAQLRHVTDLAGDDALSIERRVEQADRALTWLVSLSGKVNDYPFYDLLQTASAAEKALWVSSLSTQAAKVLGNLGTPHSQETLVNFASAYARPVDERKAAAEAYRVAVEGRGNLLDTKQILMQYDRYNRSENLDADTQKVLSSILDTIESQTAPKEKAANTSLGSE
ncbi:MAG: hypothetical protein ACI9HK_005929, partial [Pirellulaceae bacterium]